MKFKFKKTSIKATCYLLILIALSPMLVLITNSAATVRADDLYPANINSVLISTHGETLSVSATIDKRFINEHKRALVYLFALAPGETELDGKEPVASGEIEQNFSLTLKLSGDKNHSLIYSTYVLALHNLSRKYDVISTARCLDNPERLSSASEPYLIPYSKKGLYIASLSDAELLGVSQTVITIPINEYLSDKPSDDPSLTHSGIHFRRDKIYELDSKIKSYTGAGIYTYLNFTLTQYYLANSAAAQALYVKEAADTDLAGYMVDTTSPQAIETITAVFEFFAARYTRADKQFGFAGDFIVGNEVNDNRNSCYASNMSPRDFADSYSVLLRIADVALRSHYAPGTVYVSVSNKWSNSRKAYENFDETLDYPASEFLLNLDAAVKRHGDFPWGVSFNPFASDSSNYSVWRDELATQDNSTPYLTAKNFDVAIRFMERKDLLFDGSPRSIIVGKFGVSGYHGNIGEANQATSYAYAYYNITQSEYVDAFIYYSHADDLKDYGRYYGLRLAEDGTQNTPGSKKSIYTIFANIDIALPSVISSSCMSLLGSDMWGSTIPGITDEDYIPSRIIYSENSIDGNYGEVKWSVMFDFTDGNADGFTECNGASANLIYDIGGDKTYYSVKFPTNKIDYCGTAVIYDAGFLKNGEKLRINFGENIPDCDLMLRITTRTKNGTPVIFEGISSVVQGQSSVVFDIAKFSSYSGEGEIKIWFKKSSSGYIEEIPLLSVDIEYVNHMPILLKVVLVILAVIGTLVFICAAGLAILIIRAQIIRRIKRKKRLQMQRAHKYKK